MATSWFFSSSSDLVIRISLAYSRGAASSSSDAEPVDAGAGRSVEPGRGVTCDDDVTLEDHS